MPSLREKRMIERAIEEAAHNNPSLSLREMKDLVRRAKGQYPTVNPSLRKQRQYKEIIDRGVGNTNLSLRKKRLAKEDVKSRI